VTAVYVFDDCAAGDHKKCPGEKDMPTDPEVCGGAICVCECHQR
jgi:hypothetical protein